MEKHDRRSNKRNKFPRYNMSTYAEFEQHIAEVAKRLNVEQPDKAKVIRAALEYVIEHKLGDST